MFSLEEYRKIIVGHKFHWSNKVKLIYKLNAQYSNEHKAYSTAKLAYDLNLSEKYIIDSLMLAMVLYKHPKFSLLPNRVFALDFWRTYRDNDFRYHLNYEATKYKSIEQLTKLRREWTTELAKANKKIENDSKSVRR